MLLEVNLDEGHYPSVEFVPAFGTPLVRQQPCQALADIGGLGLMAGGAGDAEQGRGMRLGGALYPYQAQHLVFDLHQVARVEERIGQESGGLYPLGTRAPSVLRRIALGSWSAKVILYKARHAGKVTETCQLKRHICLYDCGVIHFTDFRRADVSVWTCKTSASKSSTRNQERPSDAHWNGSSSATLVQVVVMDRRRPASLKYMTRSSPQFWRRVVSTNCRPCKG